MTYFVFHAKKKTKKKKKTLKKKTKKKKKTLKKKTKKKLLLRDDYAY